MAQEAHAFIKSLLDAPVLYGGSVKPDNAAEPARAAGRRRCARRRRVARRRLLQGDMRDGRTYPLVALVILDGWGIAPPGPGQRDRARRHAGLRPAVARLPARAARSVGRGRRPAGRARWGTPRSGHLTIGSGRILFQDLVRVNKAIETGRAVRERGPARCLRARRERPPARPRLPRRRPLAHRPPPGAAEFAPEKTWIHAFTDGRDVSAALGGARPGRAARRPDRDRRRPLLRDGPRQALGPHRARAARDRGR